MFVFRHDKSSIIRFTTQGISILEDNSENVTVLLKRCPLRGQIKYRCGGKPKDTWHGDNHATAQFTRLAKLRIASPATPEAKLGGGSCGNASTRFMRCRAAGNCIPLRRG
jgi:hypothetical protein